MFSVSLVQYEVLITALLSAILCGLHELRLILQESGPFRFRRTNRTLIAHRNQHDEEGAGRNCELEEVWEKLGLGASQMCEIWGWVLSCKSISL
jgi:hypothetical protein